MSADELTLCTQSDRKDPVVVRAYLLAWSIRIQDEDLDFIGIQTFFFYPTYHFFVSSPFVLLESGSRYLYDSKKNIFGGQSKNDENERMCHDVAVTVLRLLTTQFATLCIQNNIKIDQAILSILDEELRRALDNLKEALKVEKEEDMVDTANSC